MSDVDPLTETLNTLRREYLAESPARVLELRKDYAAILAGERDAAASLKGRLHKLAGSGGSYGYPEISDLARRARLVKTYRDFPLERRRQELLDQFTCGASKDKPGPTNDASRPVQIPERDFPPPRQPARQ